MSNIRNVAVLSHSGAGKTSLVESMLWTAGSIDTLGSVEAGTSQGDTLPEEQRRKISITTSVHPLTWEGHRFNLLDAPGYADFVGEIRGAQAAADAALIVISAVSGVAVGTERVWTSSFERELSTLFVINKMDRENADFFRTMVDIEQTLPGNIAAVQIPIGQAEDFRGVVDLLRMKAYTFDAGKESEGDIPAEVRGVAEEYRERLVEAIVETDDDLMMQYLEGEELDPITLRGAFYQAVRRNELTPVLLTSAIDHDDKHPMGIERLLEFMTGGVRFVEDHQPLPVLEGDPPTLGEGGPFSARVFKTVIDPYLGRVSMMRVLSGTLRAGDTVFDAASGEAIRAAHLYTPRSDKLDEVKELAAGEIGALTKVEALQTGATVTTKDNRFVLAPIRYPSQVMALALFPASRSDEDKMGDALQKVTDADPTLRLEHDPDTHETVLWGMGHVHLQVAINTLKDRFGVTLETRTPRIAYRETIQGQAGSRYRHKKQTGGAGQFAEVELNVAPLPRGGGFEFGWLVTGGSIPTTFKSSCEKGITQALGNGPLGGFPVVDVKAIVTDGKDHPVDSKDIAFQVAAGHAFSEAMQKAHPVLLEPVALVKVRVPDRFTGDVISDMNTRRGRILGVEAEGSVSVVSAHVPVAEIQTYSPELRSMTGGRGAFSVRVDHYDNVPQHLIDKVLQGRQEATAG